MILNLETLIPYDRILKTPNDVFDLVDEHGQVVLLRNNAPIYIITKAGDATEFLISEAHDQSKKADRTLQEAMKLVLHDAEDNQMHAADLADAIFRDGLYFKKDGSKAEYNQIRARCGHYPNMFEALPGNIIKLKMTGAEEFIAATSNFEIGREYSTAEIVQAYRDYGGTKSEPFPSDYCYNCTNDGIDFSVRSNRLFEKTARGKYIYLGQNNKYSREAHHTNRHGKKTYFGKWNDGEFTPVNSEK